MAAPWLRRSTWPIPIDEHATNLSAFLHEVLSLIERNGSQQPLPVDIVGDIIRGALTFCRTVGCGVAGIGYEQESVLFLLF